MVPVLSSSSIHVTGGFHGAPAGGDNVAPSIRLIPATPMAESRPPMVVGSAD